VLRVVDDVTDRFLRVAAGAAAATAAAKRIGNMDRASSNLAEFWLHAAKSAAAAAAAVAGAAAAVVAATMHNILALPAFTSPAHFRAASTASAAAAAKVVASILLIAMIITFALYHTIFTLLPSHAVTFLLRNPGPLNIP
jgi:hypothetical protein